MTPPQAQLQIDPVVRAWFPPIVVRSAPGTQRPITAGLHGIGVSTPSAALVAAATVGFAKLMHIPKVMMFIPGTVSCTEAAGWPSIITLLIGMTISDDGAMPKLHCMTAPLTTEGGMISPLIL
jgi:hypothetical protein